MRRILLQVLTVCILINFVGKDIFKSINSRENLEFYGLEKINEIEDESEVKTFKITESCFLCHSVALPVFHHSTISETCAQQLHPCDVLNIFSPPPDVC